MRGRIYGGPFSTHGRLTAAWVVRDVKACRNPRENRLKVEGANGLPEGEAELIKRRAKARPALAHGEESGRIVYEDKEPLTAQTRAEYAKAGNGDSRLQKENGTPPRVAPTTGDTAPKSRGNAAPEPVAGGAVRRKEARADATGALGVRV